MAVFEKRSLLQTSLLTICTFGLYIIYWSVVTKRELNRAGGHVPNAFLMIVPIADLYFWYRYAQNYALIIKKNNQRSEVVTYFLVALMPSLASWAGFSRLFSGILGYAIDPVVRYILPWTNVVFTLNIMMVCGFLISIGLIIAKITVFQEGYNNYQG